MGKATFVRYVAVLPVRYVVVALPCAGGVLFLLGSFCFWPGSGEAATTVGAACFLVGSLCYWAAPFLDFWELTHNLDNLVDRPLVMPEAVSSAAHARMSFHAALYEQLYKAHLLRLQRANSIIFMAGGAFFVAGSSLFFPAMEELIMHGGWLYITGCVLVLLAALLGALTAAEMQQTAAIRSGWSDEEATLLSCGFYVVGSLAPPRLAPPPDGDKRSHLRGHTSVVTPPAVSRQPRLHRRVGALLPAHPRGGRAARAHERRPPLRRRSASLSALLPPLSGPQPSRTLLGPFPR